MKYMAGLLGFLRLHQTVSFHLFSNKTEPSTSQSNNDFVVPESRLEAILHEPPSLTSTSGGTASAKSIDIVSLGSLTRLDYLTGQISTWARHAYVRHFWGFSELQDYNTECSSMSAEEEEGSLARCKDPSFRAGRKGDHGTEVERMTSFFQKYYGLSEGSQVRSRDPGWICAQRRLGRAFGWLHSMYSSSSNGMNVPDYLMIVDDDTYVDLVHVVEYMEKQEQAWPGRAFASSGCVFRQDEVIPFPISYGGFGTILNKAAVKRLSEPMYCNIAGDISSHYNPICDQIAKNQVGEASLFKDGMSVFQLFYFYSALKDFCMHSDWILSYVLEFFLPQSSDVNHDYEEAPSHKNLIAITNYPSCGNLTVTTGNVRPCTLFSYSCHNLAPNDMEVWALSSFAMSPESYSHLPKLDSTEWDVAMEGARAVKKLESKERIQLPNLFLIGADSAATTPLADWLSSNHVCSPKPDKNGTVLSNKNVHFFDDLSRYSQGVGFYSKYFQHCIGNNRVIMDAAPEVLMYSERVFDMYQQVDPDVLSNLKSIIVLREPLSKEVSQFLHNTNTGALSFENFSESIIASPSKIGEHVRHLKTWASTFNRQNVLVLSFDELLKFPSRSQWRVEQFLDMNFQVTLESIGVKDEGTPLCSLITLVPYITRANEELYHFMDSVVGPWMEEHPFPHFVVPTCFAYASVLGWNPDESQNKVYLDAMRVLVQSLRHSIADFIVMMMYHDHEAESLLLSEGATVVHIAPLHHSLDVTYFEPWFVAIALAKLRAFELTKYARVQVLDVDTSVLEAENMDKLFTLFSDSKLVAEGLGSDSPLRAGWFMLQPSEKDFLNIQGILDRGVFTNEHGWDNLDLPVEYPGWKSSHPSRTWEFYGSQLEQGLLFHYFYALPKYNDPTLKDTDLLTLLDDTALLSFQFIHFYGEKKPWVNNTNAELIPEHLAIAKKKWLNDRDNLTSAQRLEESRHHHPLPLTKLGFYKYESARVLYDDIVPTSLPSTSPTWSPSSVYVIKSCFYRRSPSTSPTGTPTCSPSTSPSISPTSSPSLSPSESPTSAPSSLPTTSPSTSPTSSDPPSVSPRPTSPTTSPSSSPTMTPSISPISPPSASPIVSPTKYPTTSPSISPSAPPSNHPTDGPTVSPTHSPSTSPSTSSTSLPSVSPSVSPTSSPSSLPTKSPSTSATSSDSPSASSIKVANSIKVEKSSKTVPNP